ncbi:MAG: hypothetical protein BRD51_01815, partial [Bacteroidetes bacterium SW_11_64_17]
RTDDEGAEDAEPPAPRADDASAGEEEKDPLVSWADAGDPDNTDVPASGTGAEGTKDESTKADSSEQKSKSKKKRSDDDRDSTSEEIEKIWSILEDME